MGAIVIQMRYDEGTESAEVATSDICMLYLHQRPIFFKANSSIFPILELIHGAQCLIEVIRYSGEEM
jgi:predicted ribosome-associated RNA-binding protein Tma20